MLDYEGSRQEFLAILAELGEEPAFVSRARAPEQALDQLLKTCDTHREQLLQWPRRHFTVLRDRIRSDWNRVLRFVQENNASSIFDQLGLQLPVLAPYDQPLFATDRYLLQTFLESAGRFNRQWGRFLEQADLESINTLRDEYNRYYPVERAAALGTERVNVGFCPLPMLERRFLYEQFPLLQLPTLR
jgi:hypothetical protein